MSMYFTALQSPTLENVIPFSYLVQRGDPKLLDDFNNLPKKQNWTCKMKWTESGLNMVKETVSNHRH